MVGLCFLITKASILFFIFNHYVILIKGIALLIGWVKLIAFEGKLDQQCITPVVIVQRMHNPLYSRFYLIGLLQPLADLFYGIRGRDWRKLLPGQFCFSYF